MRFSCHTLLAAIVACVCVLLASADVMAQGRGARNGGARAGIGSGGTGPNPQLLRREDVREELELTEEQIASLKDLDQNRGGMDRQKLREEFEGMTMEERRSRMMELRKEREESVKKQLSEILLPFQLERLNQISNQMLARGGGTSLLNGPIAEQLNITDEQKERIREKAEKLQKELTEKIAKLREEMQEELLGELDSDQRKEFKAMMGDKFEFGSSRGPRGGDRAGRGGGRGEGRRGGRNRDRGGRERSDDS